MERRGYVLLIQIVFFVLLTGCRVRVDVPEGGHVNVAESYSCFTLHCVEEVLNNDYKAVYEAFPDHGYVFVEWDRGDGFLFGGETNPRVEIDASVAKTNLSFQKVIDSDQTFFLRPIFALENYDTAPQGQPDLFQLDCDACQGPMPVDWGVPLRQEVSLGIYGGRWVVSDVFVLATFVIYANEYDYKLQDLTALVEGQAGVAYFDGIRNGQVLRKGSHTIFRLVTTVPDSALGFNYVKAKYSFNVAGTGANFDVTLGVHIGDRCPVC